jgi:hypothetical protein
MLEASTFPTACRLFLQRAVIDDCLCDLAGFACFVGASESFLNFAVCFYSPFSNGYRDDKDNERALSRRRRKAYEDGSTVAQSSITAAQRVPIWFARSQICNSRCNHRRPRPQYKY